jgi:hypothetical protein
MVYFPGQHAFLIESRRYKTAVSSASLLETTIFRHFTLPGRLQATEKSHRCAALLGLVGTATRKVDYAECATTVTTLRMASWSNTPTQPEDKSGSNQRSVIGSDGLPLEEQTQANPQREYEWPWDQLIRHVKVK